MLTIDNHMVPIAATVFMNEQTLATATKAEIVVIEICRNHDDLAQERNLYDGTHDNVVGMSFSLRNLLTAKIENIK